MISCVSVVAFVIHLPITIKYVNSTVNMLQRLTDFIEIALGKINNIIVNHISI